jgi:hypothetical protein
MPACYSVQTEFEHHGRHPDASPATVTDFRLTPLDASRTRVEGGGSLSPSPPCRPMRNLLARARSISSPRSPVSSEPSLRRQLRHEDVPEACRTHQASVVELRSYAC